MSVHQLSFLIPRAQAQAVEDGLFESAALSVSLEDPGGEPILEPGVGESPLWETVHVKALFDDAAIIDAARQCLFDLLGELPEQWLVETLPDQSWERVWLEHFKPMSFGQRLWIVPTGHEAPRPEAVNLQLDPGLAFGTGTHPTTALCLRFLDETALDGERLVDYGCGSGVLAIAALLLGAAHVDAVDNDPQALLASRDNAARNGVDDRLAVYLPEDFTLATPADGVIANILAGVLIELAPRIVEAVKPGGWLALSGILEHQADAVIERYAPWVSFVPRRQQDEWILLCGRRR